MSTPSEIADRIQSDIAGLATYADITAETTGTAVIQALIDIIEPQATQTMRGHLDQISPAAHRQLLAELYAIQTKIAAWHA
jgi:hypothetical protein